MKYEIVYRHEDMSSALRSYTQERLDGIERFGEEFEEGEVIFETVHGRVSCEAILRRRKGEPFIASDTMDDARQALDSVIGKLERQFLKFKDKHSAKARRHRAND